MDSGFWPLLFPFHWFFTFFRGGSLLGVVFCLVSDFSKVNFGVFTPKFSLFSSWGLTGQPYVVFVGFTDFWPGSRGVGGYFTIPIEF